MVQLVKFPAGSRCVRNLTPYPENQSNLDLESSMILFKSRISNVKKVNITVSDVVT